jgi:hypothetical protein
MCYCCRLVKLREGNRSFKGKYVFTHYVDENGFDRFMKQRMWNKLLVSYKKCFGIAEEVEKCQEHNLSMDSCRLFTYLSLFRFEINRVCRKLIDLTGSQTRMKFRSTLCSFAKTINVYSDIEIRGVIHKMKEFKHSSVWQIKKLKEKEDVFNEIFKRDFKVESYNEISIKDRLTPSIYSTVQTISEFGMKIRKSVSREKIAMEERKEQVEIISKKTGKKLMRTRVKEYPMPDDDFIPYKLFVIKRKSIIKHDGIHLNFDKLYDYYLANRTTRNDELIFLKKHTRRKGNILPISKDRLKFLLDKNGEGINPWEIAAYKTFRDILENKYQFNSRLREFRWLYKKFAKERQAIQNEIEIIKSVKNVVLISRGEIEFEDEEGKQKRRERIKEIYNMKLEIEKTKQLRKRLHFIQQITYANCFDNEPVIKLYDKIKEIEDKLRVYPDPRKCDEVEGFISLNKLYEESEKVIRQLAQKYRHRLLNHEEKKMLSNLVLIDGKYSFVDKKTLREICECQAEYNERLQMSTEDSVNITDELLVEYKKYLERFKLQKTHRRWCISVHHCGTKFHDEFYEKKMNLRDFDKYLNEEKADRARQKILIEEKWKTIRDGTYKETYDDYDGDY